MNKDIEIMIKLQGCWDNITKFKSDIEKSNKSTSLMEKALTDKSEEVSKLDSDVKNIKNIIKQSEVDLAQLDDKVQKLEDRRNLLKSVRELEALDNELEMIKTERGGLEEKLIMDMDNLDEIESRLKKCTEELKDSRIQAESDTKEIREKIAKCEKLVLENQSMFDQLIDDLSISVKSKFLKLLNSKGGKAIAEVKGEICEYCNFQIPLSLAIEASRDHKISICTNCSRFIYKVT